MREYAFIVGAAGLLFLLDFYVFRNWSRFVRGRPRLRWTRPWYAVFLVGMPLVLPIYFHFSRWWEVEPKLMRAVVIGFWALYYLPRLIIAAGLVVKDLARFVMWLFTWFKTNLQADGAPARGAPDLADMRTVSRRDFLQQAGWTAAAVPFVIVGYGVFRTLYDFRVYRVDLPITNLPRPLDGLQIAQLSDLHAGSFFSRRPVENAVDMVNELQPDLVAITGDYVNHDVAELDVVQPALERLQAPLGVFGCLGNHDHYADTDALTGRIRAMRVQLLVNQHQTLDIDGSRLHIIGTDNTGFRQHFADLPAALDGLSPEPNGEELRLLLAHDPTFWDDAVRTQYPNIDLMLCGHTHGGQIGLELGPLRWSLAKTMYERWAGLYSETVEGARGERPNQYLYVNRGLGTVGPPIRMGIEPEITLLTLRRA